MQCRNQSIWLKLFSKDMGEELASIVIDNGSFCCRVGLAESELPHSEFPTVIGSSSNNSSGNGSFADHEREEAIAWEYPIQSGRVQNWESMEVIWAYAFGGVLGVNTNDYPVLLTEPCLNPSADRERATEIMFEVFNVPRFYLALQPTLSLLANTRTTGCVVSSGDGVTQVTSIIDGHHLPHAVRSLDIAGRDLTEHLTRLILCSGCLSGAAPHEVVREMKEKLIYIPYDLNEEMGISKHRRSKFYELPDGSGVTLDDARILCPEELFTPTAATSSARPAGIQQCIIDCIQLAPEERQSELYENILLAGGNTLIPGFADRLTKEIALAAQQGQRVIVYAPEDRRNSAWLGGSIQASLPGFWDEAVSKADYEEHGPSIIHRKCA